jgi:hypothetical protein
LSDKLKYDATQKSISDKFDEINPLYDRIRNKLEELNIYNRLDDIESVFKMNATEEQAKQMISYLNKYISFRKATEGMLIFGLDLTIRNIDDALKGLYKFINGTDAKEFEELISSSIYIKIPLFGQEAYEQGKVVERPAHVDVDVGVRGSSSVAISTTKRWVENKGCYENNDTDEYRQYLTVDSSKKFIQENPSVIIVPQSEAVEQSESNANKVNDGKPQRYTFCTSKITEVYNFCIGTHVLDRTVISEVDFINAVNSADFGTIYGHAEERKRKCKCKYIIFILSKLVTGNGWYLNTAHSINTEPSRCSGITVPEAWKKGAKAIR